MSSAIREKLEPVLHWYQSDEAPGRNTVDIVEDVAADLQRDRDTVLKLQRLAQQVERECLGGAQLSALSLALDILRVIKAEPQ